MWRSVEHIHLQRCALPARQTVARQEMSAFQILYMPPHQYNTLYSILAYSPYLRLSGLDVLGRCELQSFWGAGSGSELAYGGIAQVS